MLLSYYYLEKRINFFQLSDHLKNSNLYREKPQKLPKLANIFYILHAEMKRKTPRFGCQHAKAVKGPTGAHMGG